MTWIKKNRIDAATGTSVVLSAAVGIVGNVLVSSPKLSIVAVLLTLIVSLAGLEIARRRLGDPGACDIEEDVRPADRTLPDNSGLVTLPKYVFAPVRSNFRNAKIALGGSVNQSTSVTNIDRSSRGATVGSILPLGVGIVIGAGVIWFANMFHSPPAKSITSGPAPMTTTASSATQTKLVNRTTLITGSPVNLDSTAAGRIGPDLVYTMGIGLQTINGTAIAAVHTRGNVDCSSLEFDNLWVNQIDALTMRTGSAYCLRFTTEKFSVLTIEHFGDPGNHPTGIEISWETDSDVG